MTGRILIVEDDAATRSALCQEFHSDGWRVIAAVDAAEACTALDRTSFDVVLTDFITASMEGLALARACRKRQPGVRVIIMTAYETARKAMEVLGQGAYDYLTKPFRAGEVTRAARQAIRESAGFEDIIGRSKPMQALFDRIRAVSDSDAPVLLSGPSGSGKELVARAIHRNSRRAAGPLVAVNCGSISEQLLESELFGHERGAFTGAEKRREGLVTAAHGGTLFLDEIGEMPPALQVRMLRVLQDHLVRPIGRNDTHRVDFRLVSATNRELRGLVREGRFREDLFYRLAVIPIRVPTLRERPEDIALLARHFLDRVCGDLDKPLDGFEPEALDWLVSHSWPGNVRELENAVQRAATLSRGPRVGIDELRVESAVLPADDLGGAPTLAELEMRYIRQVLARTNGDKRRAARILGVSVRTLQRVEAGARASAAPPTGSTAGPPEGYDLGPWESSMGKLR
ncbi:MAG TPA: sigma-54 dependent transcriptional regulator [Methylomirabilota bacterium]